MTEIEVPLEKVQEHINEHALHESQNKFVGQIALFSAILAVLAAICALMAGQHANESMILHIKSSDTWSHFQAKSIKASVLQSKIDFLKEMGKSNEKDLAKIEEYKTEQEELSHKAKEYEAEAAHHLETHEKLARAVTLFQVSIAIAAITVLTKRRRYFYVSLAFSIIGLLSFLHALIK